VDTSIRTVSCRLALDVAETADAILSVAASARDRATETLSVTLDGVDVLTTELDGGHGTRLHQVLEIAPGTLSIRYDAVVTGRSEPPIVDDVDLIRFLRPSRYCESDRLAGFANSEFRGLENHELLHAVSSWVGTRLVYVSGSSRPIDGAVATLLANEGVCRDFAHLAIALLRALDVPARMVSVYAPGLDPMDFHAVVEAHVDGHWYVVDATSLAPRQSLVRIATGRDAADTAFLTITRGAVTLEELEVTAVVDPSLPFDDTDVDEQLG
jgi:transglutaminase-like putative cysteine protease